LIFISPFPPSSSFHVDYTSILIRLKSANIKIFMFIKELMVKKNTFELNQRYLLII